MLLLFLSYLGGVLTIISPCILPVLPFVFARAGQPFLRSTVPMLAGMAFMFAIVATLAAVGGGWAVEANHYGRWAAIALLGLFGLALLFPSLSERATRPLVAWGSRLSQSAGRDGGSGGAGIGSSFLLGIATGLLWAPCAGPILGLILTGAALQGASIGTSFLLLAYALGAATSLALALLVGGRLFKAMKQSLGTSEWLRRALGALVLVSVAAIALGLDTAYLAKVSTAQTNAVEQGLARALGLDQEMGTTAVKEQDGRLDLPIEGRLPPLDGITHWFNSPPLTREQLRGKVVLIDFWTYSCINCLRTLPYVRAWADRYRDDGLVVIGVHAPEFAFEKDLGNVAKAVKDLGVTYPVAVDNDFAVWRAFENRYWPAHYFIDAQGRIRYHHFGEGNQARSEQVIRQLLAEAGHNPKAQAAQVDLKGVGATAALPTLKSGETYLGYERTANFMSPGGIVRNRSTIYKLPPSLLINRWALGGRWTIGRENVRLDRVGGTLAYRFHARDLHLVLGAPAGTPVRFRIRIDGKPPGPDHGMDADASGNGTIESQRLYQLVRQQGPIREHLFEIEFLDPGAEAFAFTFG